MTQMENRLFYWLNYSDTIAYFLLKHTDNAPSCMYKVIKLLRFALCSSTMDIRCITMPTNCAGNP